MAERSRYLLTYDIRDAKRLRHVHRIAVSYGDPLQYSVFICDLTRVELIRLKSDMLNEISVQKDSVGIFDLGPPVGRGLKCVEFLGTKHELPGDGAAIW